MDADLTAYAGIGGAIAGAIREIAHPLEKLAKLRSASSPELAGISAFPRLDPRRVLRIYKEAWRGGAANPGVTKAGDEANGKTAAPAGTAAWTTGR